MVLLQLLTLYSFAATVCTPAKVNNFNNFWQHAFDGKKLSCESLTELTNCIYSDVEKRAKTVKPRHPSSTVNFEEVYAGKIKHFSLQKERVITALCDEAISSNLAEFQKSTESFYNYHKALSDCLVNELEIRGSEYQNKFGLSCNNELLRKRNSTEANLKKDIAFLADSSLTPRQPVNKVETNVLRIICEKQRIINNESDNIATSAKAHCISMRAEPRVPGTWIASPITSRQDQRLKEMDIVVEGRSAGGGLRKNHCFADFEKINDEGREVLVLGQRRNSCNYTSYDFVLPKARGEKLGNQFYDSDCNLNMGKFINAYHRGLARHQQVDYQDVDCRNVPTDSRARGSR